MQLRPWLKKKGQKRTGRKETCQKGTGQKEAGQKRTGQKAIVMAAKLERLDWSKFTGTTKNSTGHGSIYRNCSQPSIRRWHSKKKTVIFDNNLLWTE